MIISASRRTDIPAYYANWLFQRLKEGFALVRNPMNPRQVSRIPLTPDTTDGIVFWTKNPAPMLDRLDALKDYTYYFQFTLTAYDRDIEAHLPSKNAVIVPAFLKLAEKIGPDRVIWRYDPILISDRYTPDYHVEAFHKLARRLAGHTRRCVISFIDCYRHMDASAKALGLVPLGTERTLAARLSPIAREFGIQLETCAEQADLSEFGIRHTCCIDAALLSRLSGRPIDAKKDKNQRPLCGCAQSVDIGTYDSCPGGCAYCYALHNKKRLERNLAAHNPLSPLLIGGIEAGDIIKERIVHPAHGVQMNLFDQERE